MKKFGVALLMLGLGLCVLLLLNWNASADGTGNTPSQENGDFVIDSETREEYNGPVYVGSSGTTGTPTYHGRYLVRNSTGYWFVLHRYRLGINDKIILAISDDTIPTSFDSVILVGNGEGILDSSHASSGCSIEIDHNDVMHITYISEENPSDLYYSQCDTSLDCTESENWKHADGETTGYELLEDLNEDVLSSAISTHYNGDISVVWTQRNDNRPHYIRWDGSNWGSIEQVPNVGGTLIASTIMHIDLEDNIHLAWRQSGTLDVRYSVRRSDIEDWRNCENTSSNADIVSNTGSSPVLIADEDGMVLYMFHDGDSQYYDKGILGTGWEGAVKYENTTNKYAPSFGFAADSSIYNLIENSSGEPDWISDVIYSEWDGSSWSAFTDVDTTGNNQDISVERYSRFDSIGFVYNELVDGDENKVYFDKLTVTNPKIATPVTIQIDDYKINQGDDIELQVEWIHPHSLVAYRFGWDDSGSWVNESWISSEFWGKNAWSNISKKVTVNAGSTVNWRVWARDIHYNVNDTGLQSFIVNTPEGTGNYPPPEYGDWIITNETHVWNDTIVLNGNLSIEDGGSLTFNNVLLKMNCTEDGEFGIRVNDGGKFYIYDYDNNPETKLDRSNITANDNEYEFKFLVDSGSEFEMRNSELSECGYISSGDNDGRDGLTIKTDNAIFENSTFYNNHYGIYLYYSENNQITNNKISNNHYGIYLFYSENNQLINNSVYSNVDGINLYRSSNNQITNNSVSNNVDGINLYRSSNIKMRDNIINNNKYNFGVEYHYIPELYNDIDISNTINGKPIYYIQNQNNLLFDNSTNIGYLGLISCSNATIKNLSISNNRQGILIANTTESFIENCIYYNNENGIYLAYSNNNNQITNNNVSNNDAGIYLWKSSNNQITKNDVSKNEDGIVIIESGNNQITNNNVSNNENGIYIVESSSDKIINSTITESTNYDFYFGYKSDITVINTIFNKDNVYLDDEYSELTVKWYLHVSMHDENNLPIQNAKVTVKDLKEVEIFNDTTGLDGWVRWILCTEYIKTQSGSTYYTEHTIIGEKDDILGNKTVKMNKSKFIILEPKWYDAILECIELEKSTNPGESVFYQIKISNKGIKSDKITLEIINPKNWLAYLNSYHAFLSKDEEKTVFLTVKPPEDEKEGIISSIHVKATSNGNTSVQDSIMTKTTVNFVQDIGITQDLLKGSIDQGVGLKYEIQLENLGNGDEEIHLKMNNSLSDEHGGWGVVIETDIEHLEIEIGELGTTSVIITPTSFVTANEQKKLVFDVFSKFDDIFLGSIATITTVNQTHYIEIYCEEIEKSRKPSETVIYVLNLTNNGNGEETINFILSGENNGWGYLDLELPFLQLDVGESKEINLLVTIPPNTSPIDKAKIEVIAIAGNERFSINITTLVEQIHDISLSCDYPDQNSKHGENVYYYFEIINNGMANENFTFQVNLSQSNIPENWKIEPMEITEFINISEKKIIAVKVTPSPNTVAHEKAEIVFEVVSLDNVVLNSQKTTTTITQFYEIFLEIDKEEQEVIIGQNTEYKIKVTNYGNGKDTVRLELSGENSNWGYLYKNILILDGYESSNIILTVTPLISEANDEKAIIGIQAITLSGEPSNFLSTTTTLKNPEMKELIADFKILLNNKEVTKIIIGEIINFDASESNIEEGNIIDYIWNFGNGVIKNGETVDYAYPENTKEKEYNVTLIIVDENGSISEKSMIIEVLKDKEEDDKLLPLIFIVLLIFSLIIVIMLFKTSKTVKKLRSIKAPSMNISKKGIVLSLEEERKKEEQKRKEMEMWKPMDSKKTIPQFEQLNVSQEKRERKDEVFFSVQPKVVEEGKDETFHSELPKVAEEEKPKPIIIPKEKEEIKEFKEMKQEVEESPDEFEELKEELPKRQDGFNELKEEFEENLKDFETPKEDLKSSPKEFEVLEKRIEKNDDDFWTKLDKMKEEEMLGEPIEEVAINDLEESSKEKIDDETKFPKSETLEEGHGKESDKKKEKKKDEEDDWWANWEAKTIK